MASEAWKILDKAMPETTRLIELFDDDEVYDCFELSTVPALQALTVAQFPTAFYVNVEVLEPEGEARVFNLTFFSEDRECLGSAELTSEKLYWDE